MTAIAGAPPKFDMGRVVSRTFGAIGRNIVVFGVLAVALGGAPQVLVAWYQSRILGLSAATAGAPGVVQAALSQNMIGYGLSVLLLIASLYILQAALVHGVVADLNGRKASLGECLGKGVRFFLPLIAIAILMTIALIFGFLLFIVPGIIMALAWMVVIPVEVVERKGVFGSFSRSAELTRNHRGALFGLTLIYVALTMILSMAITGAAGGMIASAGNLGALYSWPVLLASGVASTIQAVIGAAGVASVYYELRSIKEGVGPEALASVFD